MQGSSAPLDSPAIPLFVFGVARSGTSYFHDLLQAHPQIRVSYEGRLVREGDYVYRQFRDLDDPAVFRRLLDGMGRVEATESQNRWIVECLQTFAEELYREHRRNPGFPQLLESIYMKPAPVRCWANKMLRVEACPDVLRLWPTARVVILIRDPRAVYLSQRRRFQSRIKYSTIYWNTHARWTRLHRQDADRYLVIRYEDFVTSPEAHLNRVFDAVGVSDRVITRAILEARPAHSDRTERWRKELTEREVRTVEGLCFDEMKEFGYQPEIATHAERLLPVARAWETALEYARYIELDLDWWRRKKILARFLRIVRG